MKYDGESINRRDLLFTLLYYCINEEFIKSIISIYTFYVLVFENLAETLKTIYQTIVKWGLYQYFCTGCSFSQCLEGEPWGIFIDVFYLFSPASCYEITEYEKPKHEQHYHHLGKESDLRLRTDCTCIQVKTTALHCIQLMRCMRNTQKPPLNTHVDVSSRARDVIFVWFFIYIHNLWMRAAKALSILHECAILS